MISSLLIIIIFAIGLQFHLYSDFQPLLQAVDLAQFSSFSSFVDTARKLVYVRAISLVLPVLLITCFELCTQIQNTRFFTSARPTLSLQAALFSNGPKYQDLVYFLFGLIKLPVFLISILSIGTITFSSLLSISLSGIISPYVKSLESTHIPNVLFLVGAITLGEFSGYWGHRLNHKVPHLWKIHEFHHSATQMCILNVSRLSLLDGFS